VLQEKILLIYVSSLFQNVFQQFHNGMQVKRPDGVTEIYYFGIIDILIQYMAKKKMEHFMKSVVHAPDEVSVVHPEFYANRFFKFMVDLLVPAELDDGAGNRNANDGDVDEDGDSSGSEVEVEEKPQKTNRQPPSRSSSKVTESEADNGEEKVTGQKNNKQQPPIRSASKAADSGSSSEGDNGVF